MPAQVQVRRLRSGRYEASIGGLDLRVTGATEHEARALLQGYIDRNRVQFVERKAPPLLPIDRHR